MNSLLKKLIGSAAALALGVSPTIATAATTTAIHPVSPLIAVSVFGTQASAQTVCTSGASAATAAGSAAAQGQPGCVLPATDAPPPVATGAPPPPPPPTGDFGINWILAGLGALALLGGIITLFNDDDNDNEAISPA